MSTAETEAAGIDLQVLAFPVYLPRFCTLADFEVFCYCCGWTWGKKQVDLLIFGLHSCISQGGFPGEIGVCRRCANPAKCLLNETLGGFIDIRGVFLWGV